MILLKDELHIDTNHKSIDKTFSRNHDLLDFAVMDWDREVILVEHKYMS